MTTAFCMFFHYKMLGYWNMHLPWLCALIPLIFGTRLHQKWENLGEQFFGSVCTEKQSEKQR